MQLVSRRSGQCAAGFFGSIYSAPDLASSARTFLRQQQRPRGQWITRWAPGARSRRRRAGEKRAQLLRTPCFNET